MDNVENKGLKKKGPFKFVLPLILLLVVGVIGFGVYEYFRIAPRDVRFTNITSSSVTVSWNTKKAIPASVIVTEGERQIPVAVVFSGDKYFDTRDVTNAELEATTQTAENLVEKDSLTATVDDFETDVVVTDMGRYYTHHVTVTNLDPETEYSFMVGDRYIYRSVADVDGSPIAKTLEVPDSVKSPVPAYGSVKDASNTNNSIDEIPNVVDGIVYINYLDEHTGNRSNVFSSTLNENGNWYIDLSLATDSEGALFMETYDTINENILVEVLIDAGILGIWKEKQSAYVLTPSPMIILNIPNAIQDSNLESSLVRLDNSSGTVKGLTISRLIEDGESCSCVCPSGYSTVKPSGSYVTGVAQCIDTGIEECTPPTCYKSTKNTNSNPTPTPSPTTEKCLFKDYCPATVNDCVTEIGRKSCRCDQGTLDRRNCLAGNSSPQEDLTCAGGVKQGQPAYDGSRCVVCSYTKNNNYYVPKFIDGSDQYRYEGSSCVPIESAPKCGTANGESYDGSVTTILSKNLCKGSAIAKPSEVKFLDGQNTVTWKCENSVGEVSCNAQRVSNGSTDEQDDSGEGPVDIENEESVLDNVVDCWNSSGVFPLYSGTGKGRKRCVNGKWVSDPQGSFLNPAFRVQCKEGNSCQPKWSRCVEVSEGKETGRILRCSFWLKWKLDSDEYKAAINVSLVNGGEKCEDENGCICNNSLITNINWCPEVTSCTTTKYVSGPLSNMATEIVPANEGKVCSTDPNKRVCDDNGECVNESTIRGAQDNIFNQRKDLINIISTPVEAASINNYILDPQTGMFTELQEGAYIFEYNNEFYLFDVSDGEDELMIYVDVNGNDAYDEDVDIKISDIASEINIIALEQRFNYELTEGFNFVSFPFLISGEEYRTAAGLLQKLNEVYDDSIYSISTFDGGRWKIVGQNVEIYDNNDFQLLPGVGYMIKAKEDVDISIVGQPVQYETTADSAPITLFEGWNLIGLYGTGVKTYTAKTMIADINASNFTADNVSKWEKEKQSYEGFQFSESQEYGFDFPINSLESVFVRILEGRGNWQPELRTQ